jgi:hypothetical protein
MDKLHFDVMKKLVIKGGTDKVSVIAEGDRPPFSLVGYSSNRWLKYADAYLHGGPSFKDFIDQPLPKKSASTFMFGGNSSHNRGPCILSLTVTSTLIHLNARTLHWANAAILDLNLAWLLYQHYDLPVWITTPRATVLDWQLSGYSRLEELPDVDLVRRAKKFKKNPSELTRISHIKKATRDHTKQSKDEEEIILNFCRVTPEDIANHLGIKGTKIRNILRAEYGLSIKGDDRNSHSWASYTDPRFQRIASQLDIDIKKLPTIKELIATRQTSLDNENAIR